MNIYLIGSDEPDPILGALLYNLLIADRPGNKITVCAGMII